MPLIPVVVVAGGASTRFQSDKLHPSTGLLDELLAGVSSRYMRILVGNSAGTDGAAAELKLSDEMPGAGPAAAILTALRALRSGDTESPVVLLPGDSPGGFEAIQPLLGRLDDLGQAAGDPRGSGAPLAVCAADDSGAQLPLPAALSALGRRRLLEAADAMGGPDGHGAGQAPAGPGFGSAAPSQSRPGERSVRRLLAPLDPAYLPLPQRALFDVDTRADLGGWRRRDAPAARRLAEEINRRRRAWRGGRPLVVAVDSAPASAGDPGLTGLVAAVRTHVAVTALPAADFYREGEEPEVDWPRLRREALDPLLRYERVRYRPHPANSGNRSPRAVRLGPCGPLAPVVVVEGTGSGGPGIADLVDLRAWVADPAQPHPLQPDPATWDLTLPWP